jgi:hypothetical protein
MNAKNTFATVVGWVERSDTQRLQLMGIAALCQFRIELARLQIAQLCCNPSYLDV